MNKLTLAFSADHPTSAGHFPGNPIIPGAQLLAEVLRAIGESVGQRFLSVKSAKFQHPVRPGDCVEIEFSLKGVMDFKCTVKGTLVMSGTISLAA